VGGRVDLLINNAGLGGIARVTGQQERLGTFDFDDAWVVFRTMAMGPLLMAQEYLDLMKRSPAAKIANVTSGYGSIGNNDGFPYYYSAAKAALHQLMRSLAHDIRQWNMSVILLDPGSVRTDMGGSNAPLAVDESVAGMIARTDELSVETTGAFVSWHNQIRDW
jgi:NAD(P)-dependent dehydrogenase (short-subunit alcohol dehydrogenase family)